MMPISRNGSVKSQTTGKRTSASRAKGQQSTKRMHHPTKRTRAFTSLSFHHPAPRQRYVLIVIIRICQPGNPSCDNCLQVGWRMQQLGPCTSERAHWPGGGFSGGETDHHRRSRSWAGHPKRKRSRCHHSDRPRMASNPEFVDRGTRLRTSEVSLPRAKNRFLHRYDLLAAEAVSSGPSLHSDLDSGNAPRLQNFFRSPRGLGNLKDTPFQSLSYNAIRPIFPHKTYLTPGGLSARRRWRRSFLIRSGRRDNVVRQDPLCTIEGPRRLGLCIGDEERNRSHARRPNVLERHLAIGVRLADDGLIEPVIVEEVGR